MNIREPIGEAEKFYRKIVINGESFGVTIPKEMLEANGWKVGDEVVVWIKKLIKEE